MSQAIEAKAEAKAGTTYRVNVRHLVVWVLGSAIFLTLARGATSLWGTTPLGRVVNDARVAGVVLLAVAVLVAARLGADAIGRGRGLAVAPVPTAFGRLWRGLGVLFLASMAVALSTLLRQDSGLTLSIGLFDTIGWRIKLVVLGLAFGLIGLLLGAAPARARRALRVVRRRRWVVASVVSVVFAGVAGVLLLARGGMMIPYLVLLAVEAVSNAMLAPGQMADWAMNGRPIAPALLDLDRWRSVHDRIIRVGIEAGLGLASCMLTAHWLGRDLRREPGEVVAPRSWRGTVYRGLTGLATWGIGAFLIFHSLPTLHPSFAEGFAAWLHPRATSIVVASFLVLAAGITARGLAGPGVVVEPRAGTSPNGVLRLAFLLAKLGAVVVLVMVILAAIAQIRGDETLPWLAPWAARQWLAFLDEPVRLTVGTTLYVAQSSPPELLILLAVLAWIIAVAARLLGGRRSADREAPIDRVGRDPRLVARFLGAWLAMLGVMLTLFPALFLAAMAVVHLALRLT